MELKHSRYTNRLRFGGFRPFAFRLAAGDSSFEALKIRWSVVQALGFHRSGKFEGGARFIA